MTLKDRDGPRPFHRVQGLTAPEYRTLRNELKRPTLYWPPLVRSDLRRALLSALYHASLFLKTEQAVKALTVGFGAMESQSARSLASRLLTRLETRDLYLLRDAPAGLPKAWARNKARLALKMDSALIQIAGAEFPGDAEVGCRCSMCLAKWADRRLPGIGRRRKPGPKSGKRKRLQRKERQNGS